MPSCGLGKDTTRLNDFFLLTAQRRRRIIDISVHKPALQVTAAVILATLTACSKPAAPALVYKMGERVETGSMTYNVFEAEWKTQLQGGDQANVPAHRYLVVHLSATNGGAETVALPLLTLTDDSGQIYGEAAVAGDIPAVLGLVRNLKPADTLDGRVLFDVEPKSYKLKLDDPYGAGKSAMVEMPLQFTPQ
jgi:hypothetical protein